MSIDWLSGISAEYWTLAVFLGAALSLIGKFLVDSFTRGPGRTVGLGLGIVGLPMAIIALYPTAVKNGLELHTAISNSPEPPSAIELAKALVTNEVPKHAAPAKVEPPAEPVAKPPAAPNVAVTERNNSNTSSAPRADKAEKKVASKAATEDASARIAKMQVAAMTTMPAVAGWQQKLPDGSSDGDAKLVQLTTAIKRELKRVGCLKGDANGSWGKDTTGAIDRFNAYGYIKLDASAPDNETLMALQGVSTTVCP